MIILFLYIFLKVEFAVHVAAYSCRKLCILHKVEIDFLNESETSVIMVDEKIYYGP